jgi:hypothetical protein
MACRCVSHRNMIHGTSDPRAVVLAYAEHFVGTWYSWGGDDPSGFDCSGFVLEALKSVGLVERQEDMTADDLRRRFAAVQTPTPGCLAFWKHPAQNRAVHVEMVVTVLSSGAIITIGASGGGSQTTTKEAAMRDNAFIKVRPCRRDVWCYADPFAEAP